MLTAKSVFEVIIAFAVLSIMIIIFRKGTASLGSSLGISKAIFFISKKVQSIFIKNKGDG